MWRGRCFVLCSPEVNDHLFCLNGVKDQVVVLTPQPQTCRLFHPRLSVKRMGLSTQPCGGVCEEVPPMFSLLASLWEMTVLNEDFSA